MKDAMKSKNEATLRGLRAIKAAIILAKTAEGAGGKLSEADEVKLLQKLVKQRKDSLEIYQKQDRKDLAQKELEEIDNEQAEILRLIRSGTSNSQAKQKILHYAKLETKKFNLQNLMSFLY